MIVIIGEILKVNLTETRFLNNIVLKLVLKYSIEKN